MLQEVWHSGAEESILGEDELSCGFIPLKGALL